MKNSQKRNPDLIDQSDADLAAAYRMNAAEQWKLERELRVRGYDVHGAMRFEGGRVEVQIDRIEKEAL